MYKQKQAAFTIIELLIVIVIIAILAAITIVAYNGITQKANTASAQSAAEQAYKKVLAYMTLNADQVPPDLATAGITNSNGTSYQYSSNNTTNPQTFCLTATTANVSYWVNNTTQSTPTAGACAGQGANGVPPITNLVINPSVESNSSGWGFANSATCTLSTAAAIVGNNGMACSTSNSADSGPEASLGSTLQSGQVYTASASIRAHTAGNYCVSVQGASGGGVGSNRSCLSMAANQVARLSFTWTPTANGTAAFYILKNGSQSGIFNFDVDAAMLAQGTSSTYADGNSPGWAWTGTPNNSTSTGPAL